MSMLDDSRSNVPSCHTSQTTMSSWLLSRALPAEIWCKNWGKITLRLSMS